MNSKQTLVIGIGEVGGALSEVLSDSHPVLRHDLEPINFDAPIGVMHLCFPFRSATEFESAALSYIGRFHPDLTIINGTVLPGTTRRIALASKTAVAFSPVRGKHAHMAADLLRYVKFVAAIDTETAARAERHLQNHGFKTSRINLLETLELAKLAETSYFGVLIGFAQELNRFCEKLGADFYEASQFFEEIDFLPRCRYFPGIIGGHCVVPNINLLLQVMPAPLLEAVLDSNAQRMIELAEEQESETGGKAAANR